MPPSSCSGQSAPQPGIAQQPPEVPPLTAALATVLQVYSHPDPRQMHQRPERRKLPTKDERPHSRDTPLAVEFGSAADSLLAPRQIQYFGALQATGFRHFPLAQPCPAGFRSIRVHDLNYTFGYRLRDVSEAVESPRSQATLERWFYSLLSKGRMKLRTYLRTQPLSSRIRSALMNSLSTPKRLRYLSYSAKFGKLNSANARSLAPSDGRKYP